MSPYMMIQALDSKAPAPAKTSPCVLSHRTCKRTCKPRHRDSQAYLLPLAILQSRRMCGARRHRSRATPHITVTRCAKVALSSRHRRSENYSRS